MENDPSKYLLQSSEGIPDLTYSPRRDVKKSNRLLEEPFDGSIHDIAQQNLQRANHSSEGGSTNSKRAQEGQDGLAEERERKRRSVPPSTHFSVSPTPRISPQCQPQSLGSTASLGFVPCPDLDPDVDDDNDFTPSQGIHDAYPAHSKIRPLTERQLSVNSNQTQCTPPTSIQTAYILRADTTWDFLPVPQSQPTNLATPELISSASPSRTEIGGAPADLLAVSAAPSAYSPACEVSSKYPYRMGYPAITGLSSRLGVVPQRDVGPSPSPLQLEGGQSDSESNVQEQPVSPGQRAQDAVTSLTTGEHNQAGIEELPFQALNESMSSDLMTTSASYWGPTEASIRQLTMNNGSNGGHGSNSSCSRYSQYQHRQVQQQPHFHQLSNTDFPSSPQYQAHQQPFLTADSPMCLPRLRDLTIHFSNNNLGGYAEVPKWVDPQACSSPYPSSTPSSMQQYSNFMDFMFGSGSVAPFSTVHGSGQHSLLVTGPSTTLGMSSNESGGYHNSNNGVGSSSSCSSDARYREYDEQAQAPSRYETFFTESKDDDFSQHISAIATDMSETQKTASMKGLNDQLLVLDFDSGPEAQLTIQNTDQYSTSETTSNIRSSTEINVSSHPAGSDQHDSAHDPDPKHCTNCHTTTTPSWRRCSQGRFLLCNACGLFQKLHGRARPFQKTKDGHIKIVRTPASHAPCAHCGTTSSAIWRKGANKEALCNACSTMAKRHQQQQSRRGQLAVSGRGRENDSDDRALISRQWTEVSEGNAVSDGVAVPRARSGRSKGRAMKSMSNFDSTRQDSSSNQISGARSTIHRMRSRDRSSNADPNHITAPHYSTAIPYGPGDAFIAQSSMDMAHELPNSTPSSTLSSGLTATAWKSNESLSSAGATGGGLWQYIAAHSQEQQQVCEVDTGATSSATKDSSLDAPQSLSLPSGPGGLHSRILEAGSMIPITAMGASSHHYHQHQREQASVGRRLQAHQQPYSSSSLGFPQSPTSQGQQFQPLPNQQRYTRSIYSPYQLQQQTCQPYQPYQPYQQFGTRYPLHTQHSVQTHRFASEQLRQHLYQRRIRQQGNPQQLKDFYFNQQEDPSTQHYSGNFQNQHPLLPPLAPQTHDHYLYSSQHQQQHLQRAFQHASHSQPKPQPQSDKADIMDAFLEISKEDEEEIEVENAPPHQLSPSLAAVAAVPAEHFPATTTIQPCTEILGNNSAIHGGSGSNINSGDILSSSTSPPLAAESTANVSESLVVQDSLFSSPLQNNNSPLITALPIAAAEEQPKQKEEREKQQAPLLALLREEDDDRAEYHHDHGYPKLHPIAPFLFATAASDSHRLTAHREQTQEPSDTVDDNNQDHRRFNIEAAFKLQNTTTITTGLPRDGLADTSRTSLPSTAMPIESNPKAHEYHDRFEGGPSTTTIPTTTTPTTTIAVTATNTVTQTTESNGSTDAALTAEVRSIPSYLLRRSERRRNTPQVPK